MDIPHVQLILDHNQVPASLQMALNRVRARISLRSLDKAGADGISPTADLCVILPRPESGSDVLGRVLADASDRACATMVLEPADGFAGRGRSEPDRVWRRAPGGDDAPALSADELTGRIKALCEIRSLFRRMRQELAQLRHRDDRRLDEQLRLAGEIQRDLLTRDLPDTSPLAIDVFYRPADFVSGDIYDVSRPDEDHTVVSIADATGHGMPAALLTVFVKHSLSAGPHDRIREPDEVLGRLNAELLSARLSGCQFITGLHSVFSRSAGQIRWARGGLPYPVLVRPGQPPCRLASQGGLMGAFEHPQFEVAAHTFEPRDTLLFFTDGLEALLLGEDDAFSAGEVENSTWLHRLSQEGIDSAFQALGELAAGIGGEDWRKDDVTVLAVRMTNAQTRLTNQ